MTSLAIATKFCRGCNESLPATLDHFGERTDSSDGLNHRCHDCERKRWHERDARAKALRDVVARAPIKPSVAAAYDLRTRRKLGAIYGDTPSANAYRGVRGGMLLAGYVR